MISSTENNVMMLCFLIFITSCIDKDLYEERNEVKPVPEYVRYLYPYGSEARNIDAEIILETIGEIDADHFKAVIPALKYNKSWLFMLTQDDCKHAAYSTTWAAINGRPLSRNYYYSAEQLAAGDLPPDIFYLNKTLGSSDGAGNEVRFSFTTTLSPEWEWMEKESTVSIGFSRNYYRFNMLKGLTWNNAAEMVSYDTGIAFHDMNTNSVNQKDSLLKHYGIAQQITLNKLSGRGAKVLAEPGGNYTYLKAAFDYPPIRIMTAQGTQAGGPVVERHYPYRIETNLEKAILKRTFYNNTFDITAQIENELNNEKEEREAIHVGIHGTDATFVEFLLWLNNRYGKDGDDSVWFPSLEEYYEYNYYRVNATIDKEITGDTLKLRITLPSEQYFYYPSVTVNLSGVTYEQIKEISSNSAVTGLSFAPYEGGVMLNIDCRRYLAQHAAHFVDKYLNSPSLSNKNDALYFIGKLKDSSQKEELLKKIP